MDQEMFVAKEFAKMENSARSYRQQSLQDDVDSHQVAAFQMKDDFDNFDDDFFDDADTTLDYGKKGSSSKKAKGIEIQWTNMDY